MDKWEIPSSGNSTIPEYSIFQENARSKYQESGLKAKDCYRTCARLFGVPLHKITFKYDIKKLSNVPVNREIQAIQESTNKYNMRTLKRRTQPKHY